MVDIQPADQHDVPAIRDLIALAYAADRAAFPDIPDVTAGIAEDIAENQVLVIDAEGRLHAVLIVAVHDTVMIKNIAVAEEARGRGLAAILMQRAEEMARTAGLDRLTLRTHAGLERTRAIYRHLGWVETGVSGAVVSMEKTL